MTKPSPREVEHAVEQLESETATETTETPEISVLWGVADPENRPEGMTYIEETNTLTYDCWHAQRDLLESLQSGEYDLAAGLMGYGSGKTIFGTRWLIAQALKFDGSRFLCMGIDFTKARDTTFRVLFEQLPGERTGIVTSSYNGPETSPIVADYNRQNHRLTLVNDSVIKLGSADKWNRYAGDEYGAIHLDEPSHYGEDLHDLLEMLGSRLRGVAGPKVQLWTLTGNGHNAAFDILERQQDSTGDELGLTIDVIRASTLENPYLSESDKERFERQYGNTAREQQALHGGFAEATGALLSRDQLQFIHDSEVPDREYQYHLGVDLAYAEHSEGDYNAVVCAAYDPTDGKAFVLYLDRWRGVTFRKTTERLAEIATQLPLSRVKVEEVGAQSVMAQDLERELPVPVQRITPGTRSKESRLSDLGILAERGDLVLVNQEVDENLGYDDRYRPYVREWCQVGEGGNSPDILDATWYAIQNLSLGSGTTPSIIGFDPYGRNEGRRQRKRGRGLR